MADLATIVFSTAGGLLTALGGALLVRNKTKAEVEKIQSDIHFSKMESERVAVETAERVLKMQREENEQLSKRITENAEKLKQSIQANDDCEFEHGITRLQLNKALRKLDITHWVKSTVFVLDDNKMVTDVFVHRFRTIPVVAFKAFVDSDLFLEAVKKERPEVVVMDHSLADGLTAKDLIEKFDYPPEILIMSGTKENQVFYQGTDVKFFYKDAWYIRNITRAILEHLITKNQ